MNSVELKSWMKQLRNSYKIGYTGGIIESLEKIIEFLLDGLELYPQKVQRGIETNLQVFCNLKDRAEAKKIVDYEAEWRVFKVAADNLAYSVFTPWLAEENEKQTVFIGSGGDA